MTSDDHGKEALACVEIPNAEFISTIDGDEVVSVELDDGEGCCSRRFYDFVYATLAKDVDFAMTEFRFACSDGKKGLNWVISVAAGRGQVRNAQDLN